MKLKNINGTSESTSTCACGSWLKHWEKFNTGNQTLPRYCPETSCTRTDLVGAHVQKADSYDDKWYICPLCNAHNRSSETLTVSDFIALAPANKSETCEKQQSSWYR